MDDAVFGDRQGEFEGGKRGRAGRNNIPFVVAVAASDDHRPLRLLLHVVQTHDGEAIEAMEWAHLAPAARVVSN